jgi:hypothetical protein
MAPVAQRRFDDDDVFDSAIYDPAYYPKRVYRDGRGPRVPLALTDAAPAAISDAHRPHQIAATDSAEFWDAERAAEEAYAERNDRLANAWRSPDNPPPPLLKKGQSPRDAYIERVTNAWRAPPRRNDPADDVEALQRRWASPGVTPGPGRRPTQDAAAGRAEADQAYAEYCARLQAAWKTR